MFTFLIIYIIGVIIAGIVLTWIVLSDKDKHNTDVTLGDIVSLIGLTLLSWIAVGIAIYFTYEEYKETPIIKRKKL